MEFKTETANVLLYETGTCATECPVDGEYVLPDYCADIAAVLKCTMTPRVLARRIGGDKLVVEGETAVCVLYLDEGRKCVHTFECVQPFTCALPWEDDDGKMPYITAKVNYLNCRATSPRRISIHGTLSACCQQEKKRSMDVLTKVTGDAVYCKQDTLCYTTPLCNAEKVFSIKETVDVGVNKPPIQRVVRASCVAVVDSVKPLTDKAIVKGKAVVRTLYVVNTEEGRTACATHEFPFSQIIDVQGLLEEHILTAHVDVLGCDVGVQSDGNGNGTLLSVQLKMCVRLDVTACEKVTVLTDAYTGKYPCHTTTSPLSAEQLLFSCQNTTTLKEILDFPTNSVAEIVDLWCEVISLATRQEPHNSYIDGRLQISMLTRDSDGFVSYYEHVGDFVLQYTETCDRLHAEVSVVETDYAVVGGKIEIRMELAVLRCGYAQQACACVCGFETEAQPFSDEKAALRICRGKKGDSVWEIAKACHTAVDAVMEENALSDECLLEDMVLLIPLC